MGAEDFSYVLQQRPGALPFLGVCPPGEHPARAHACHSNRMMIDEDAHAGRHRDARGNGDRVPAQARTMTPRSLGVICATSGAVSSAVRARPSHGRGRRFESSTAHKCPLTCVDR